MLLQPGIMQIHLRCNWQLLFLITLIPLLKLRWTNLFSSTELGWETGKTSPLIIWDFLRFISSVLSLFLLLETIQTEN